MAPAHTPCTTNHPRPKGTQEAVSWPQFAARHNFSTGTRERRGWREGGKGRRTIKVSTTTTTAVRPSTPRSLGVCAPRGHSGRLSGAQGSLQDIVT